MILTTDQLPNRFVRHAGRDCLFFSGTSYLGMSQNRSFQALVIEELMRYGTAFGSSRNGNLQLRVYEEGEAALAGWTSAPAALTVSSGMMAGQVVMQYLQAEPHTHFVYGPNTHPALWYEQGVSLPRTPFDGWAGQVMEIIDALPSGPVVIAVNSIDAVHSLAYNFEWVANLPSDQLITLVIDDSHGIGLLGCNGRGMWLELIRLIPESVRLIVTASLAKAMGLPGGIILADADTIAAIRHTPFFGGASPMAPAPLAAFCHAEELYADAQQRLARNVALATDRLKPTGLFRQADSYPVLYTTHDELYHHLLAQDIIIYSFAYPTPHDKANTRIVISAFHEPEDIERLATVVSGPKRRPGPN